MIDNAMVFVILGYLRLPKFLVCSRPRAKLSLAAVLRFLHTIVASLIRNYCNDRLRLMSTIPTVAVAAVSVAAVSVAAVSVAADYFVRHRTESRVNAA